EQQHQRSNPEAGFSSYKRTTGGLIYHRRKDRRETSGFCKRLLPQSYAFTWLGGFLSQYRFF
ncbi:MAG: hypothetical protein QW203_06275, partial [Thermoplasmatales archaeon]